MIRLLKNRENNVTKRKHGKWCETGVNIKKENTEERKYYMK